MGKTFALPDNKKIVVILTSGELEVWCNGKELLSGLASGESDHFGNASKILIGYGIGLALVFARLFALGVIGVISGICFAGLGYWARTSKTKTPLWLAVGLLCANIIGAIVVKNYLWIAISGIMAFYLFNGIQAQPLSNKPQNKTQ